MCVLWKCVLWGWWRAARIDTPRVCSAGGGAADSEDAKKYQKLQEKDKEMTEFIDKFDDTMQKESQAVLDLEHRIVQVPSCSSYST